MKRICCLIFGLLIVLCGCIPESDGIQSPVTFYYLRSEITYGSVDGVIAGETVESFGYTGELDYLLALYFSGPTDAHLQSPFPEDIRLVSVYSPPDALAVELEGSFGGMTDLKIVEACACLAMTCFGISEAGSISIRISDRNAETTRTIEFTRDSLILQDLIPETT